MKMKMKPYDLLIKDGRVVDGTGNPWYRASIGIKGDTIVAVGSLDEKESSEVIDASSYYVVPGFIDIHSHSDLTILLDPYGKNRVLQGITTEVNGNCGISVAPVGEEYSQLLKESFDLNHEISWDWTSFHEYLTLLEEKGVGPNIVPLVGHGAIRLAVMGVKEVDPTKEEMERMKSLLKEAMESGAFGLSTGLVYPPGCFAKTQEIVELAKVVASFDGLYASHIRGERETIMEALEEALHIGFEAGIPVQVSHNCPKYGATHTLEDTIPLYDRARERGLEVTLDNDLHTDLGVYLGKALPQWVFCQGVEKMLSILKDGKERERMMEEVKRDDRPGFGPKALLKHGEWERIVIFRCKTKREDLVGKSIAQVAAKRGTPPFVTYLDLILEEEGEIQALFDYIDPGQLRGLLLEPLMMICSDGSIRPREEEGQDRGRYNPCSYSEFPYVLERFVREEGLLTLQEAIRKMTSFPAQKMRLFERGLLRPGMKADVVLFDLEKIEDRATCLYPYPNFLEKYPHRYPSGIEYVLINGQVAVEKGEFQERLAGRVLRKGRREET